MLTDKKLIELKIKKIHSHYAYPADWALTTDEAFKVINILSSAFDFERGDEDSLDDIIDYSLRIDSKTGRVFYTGHQIGTRDAVYYYKEKQDALDKINELTGDNMTCFDCAATRWDEFNPAADRNKAIEVVRITCTL